MKKYHYAINNWIIDFPSGSIIHLISGENKRLGAYQLKLLDTLQQNAGKIFTREELTNLVWERRVIGNNSLPNAIHALRTALGDDGKQQRIIRTVPKRGYVLDAEYCQEVEEPPETLAAEEESGLSIDDTHDTPASLIPAPPIATHAARTWSWRTIRGITVPLLVFAVLCIGLIGYRAVERSQSMISKELAQNVYSNIRLFTLLAPGAHLQDQAAVYNRLKDTYYILNQDIKNKSAHLSIYSRSDNQTLNYTLRLYNTCDQKILAMQIYHWRASSSSLNDLILNETRRKLDEMASCKAA